MACDRVCVESTHCQRGLDRQTTKTVDHANVARHVVCVFCSERRGAATASVVAAAGDAFAVAAPRAVAATDCSGAMGGL